MRVLIAGFHSSVAVALGFGAVVLLAQARINGVWETWLYGELSPTTAGLTLVPAMVLLLALFGLASAMGYLLKVRNAHIGLLAVSLPLVLILPAPLSWGVGLAGLGMVMELWSQLVPLLEEEEELEEP